MATETRDSTRDIWGARTPFYGDEYPVRVDERTLEDPDHWVQSACVLCSTGCGMDIGVKDGRIVGVRGRAVDIANRGRLGPKGLNGWEANNSPDRLTRPLIRRGGKGGTLEPASWDEAMALIARRSQELVDKHTAGAIGIYNTGQFFIEDYYTLAVIGKAGLGTPHMDGNTRLCTATSAAAMKESYGSDGQVAGYADLDTCDAVMHVGHNIASQNTIIWMRVLDRRRGPNPPRLVVVDPRRTYTAEEADVHLAPKVGTNVALMNGLLHLVLREGRLDRAFIEAHTLGFDQLEKTVASYTPERVAEITGVPVADLRRAAEIVGQANTLVTTVLQGVYQSNQATAAAVQVNNLHLVRGLIGKTGCGVLQMNGQPTAQNTRETGADGDLPGFRNWGNPKHIEQLAELWNVPVDKIPHWAPPTHALQIFRYAEQGSIRMLWIMATNPAVSMPNLPRIRKTLQKEDLFLVVSDAFMTETARMADVVLPAALWGEKTGCFTNAGRTVHISHKAVEPPGEARPDLDILLDYARRMNFRDQDGAPLVKWSTPEEAFEAWKLATRGRPCDYTGLSYAKLTGGSGIQWPCNEQFPDGTNNLYTDGHFNTDPDYCETYGQDFDTGASVTPEEYRALNPAGRAFIKPAEYRAPREAPDAEYPFWLTTGRLVWHFHTRTKTGRSKALRDRAPDAFVEISAHDAERLGIREGEMVEVASRRGVVREPAHIADIIPGHVFIPFHYGSLGEGGPDPDRPRAANELTMTAWDPVSKEPYFKHAAVRVRKVSEVGVVERAADAVRHVVEHAATRVASAGGQ